MGLQLDRRTFLQSMGALSLSGFPSRKRPNFVFILMDDLGWKDLGCMGSPFYETPHIDRLAKQGMLFTQAYANAPNCAPTRASLLSGQYTPRHGIYTVNRSERGKAHLRKLIPIPNKRTLDADVVTLAETLKNAGYVNACIGKWHLGKDPELGPLSQGFDVNIGGDHHGHPPAGYFAPYKLINLEEAPEGEYLTDRLTDEALGFIDTNKDKPFFLYLAHYAVHTPIQAKKEQVDRYEGKEGDGRQNNPKYAAMIESADQSVGRILDRLDRLGLSENTVVFFFSDNGGHFGYTTMAPLRGSKGMLYEGGIREPMIVRWPGRIEANTRCHVPVIGVDFYPTLLDMAGAEKPKEHTLDGESLMPLLFGGGTLKRDALYWHFPAYLEAYKGIKEPWRTTPGGAIRKGEWKLHEYFEDGRLELYNLTKDVGEQHNLAEKMPEKTRELHERLKRWRKSVNAPVPRSKNPEYDPDKKKKK